MLHTPNKRSSGLGTVLAVLAAASAGFYFYTSWRRAAPPPERAEPAQASALRPATEPAPAPPTAAEPSPPRPAAAPIVEPPPPVPVAFQPPPVPKGPLHEIEELCAQGRWREARARLAPLFLSPLADSDRTELARRGLEISQQTLVAHPEEKDVELYEIQQGDNLEGIARRFRALSGVKGAILLVNNYRENAILRVGRKVKIPRGTWSIVADRSLFRLWVCYEGAPFKGYTITTGAAGKETPVARFTVGNKNPKPAWWPPADIKVTGKIPVPYGDAQNPLGEWWIALDHDLHHGIGIHGTNDPASIGTKASNGCIRMLNEEVGEVAAIAFKGMAAIVVE
jgi:hypothetical protein